jgi:type IV pilus assembly protein PilY1
MSTSRTLGLALALCTALALASPMAHAQQPQGDIDIFAGQSGGNADAPNVMILIDNSPNWSRASQMWPDAPTQGQAEVTAISQVLTYLTNQGLDINVGLAMLSSNIGGTGSGGGYIRFGVRNMNVSANNTALQNILSVINANINASNEKLGGMSYKDETAAFYEIYKYFSGLAPYSGGPAANPLDDTSGNLGGGPTGSSGLTAYAQGLSSGWAIGANGLYQSPLSSTKPCASNYIIYVANNANGTSATGPYENVYEPSVVPALTALPAVPVGGGDTWTDEWTRFLYQSGAVVPSGNNNGAIATYVLDAYNAQQNRPYSASLRAAARQGGGRYYQVGSQAAIYNALVQIFDQIQAVNSTFASASLPVNATNRAQDKNQVYVPMFRPDAHSQPRWFGNLKQYQLINYSGAIILGDALSNPAINLVTGYPASCTQSFWTSDSTSPLYPNGYWNYGTSVNAAGNVNTVMETTYAKGSCPTSPTGKYTDLPDGPVVEKGGVAEVIRKGNNPPATNSSPTWSPSLRNVKTINASVNLFPATPVAFNAVNTGITDVNLVNWMLGQDVQDENGNGSTTETRPSVHGDEIHSRPLPVDYGSGVTRVFYGANDGTLRAVDGSTGQELWAFVAPEFYNPAPTPYVASPLSTPTGLERLMWSGMQDSSGNQISPIINFFGTPAGVTPAPLSKDWYFDGSIGIYEGALNAQGAPTAVWIYPTMRRGGRMLYAMDVTNSTSPVVLWKFGCPHLTDNTGCVPAIASDATSMGQTWSIPAVAAKVLGYGSPVIVVGGGYDACEDANSPAPSCASPKGAGVFVLDAQTGAELAFLQTTRSVAADVALIAVTTPGVVDHAYAVDTGGNIYRIDFSLINFSTHVSTGAINRIAYTNGAGRKFLFAPALLAAPGNQVYVALGSGDREHPLQGEYAYTNVVNRFYVFKDNLASTSALNLDNTTKMNDFTASPSDPGPGGLTNGTSCGTVGVLPTSTMSGWFVNLSQNGQGEQTVTSAIIAAGMVAFSTNRPVPQTTGTCSTLLGAAYGYWLNLFNASGGISATGQACGGVRDSPFVGGGLPPSPVIATVPVNGQLVTAVIGAAQLSGGVSCGICAQQVNPAIVPERKTIFWKSSGEN